jgi:predicted acyl esterase
MRFWNWVFMNSAKGSAAARDPATRAVLKERSDHRKDYLALMPLRRGTTPLRLAADLEDWLVNALDHGANDSFWGQNNIIDFPERYQDLPVYFVGGWYDSWAGNTSASCRALAGRHKSPTYLIMGPWIHGGRGAATHGQASFGPDAATSNSRGCLKQQLSTLRRQPQHRQTTQPPAPRPDRCEHDSSQREVSIADHPAGGAESALVHRDHTSRVLK